MDPQILLRRHRLNPEWKLDGMHTSRETVASARHGCDVFAAIGIPESAPQQEYHLIEIGFFHEGVGPDHLQELLLAHDFPWLFDEFGQNLNGFRRQGDYLVVPDQGAGHRIESIRTELIRGRVGC